MAGPLWGSLLLSFADVWGWWPGDSLWIPFVLDTTVRCVGLFPACFLGGLVMGRFSSKRLAAAGVLLLAVSAGLSSFGSLFFPDAFPVLHHVEWHVALLCQTAKWACGLGSLLLGILFGRAIKWGPRDEVFTALRNEIRRGNA